MTITIIALMLAIAIALAFMFMFKDAEESYAPYDIMNTHPWAPHYSRRNSSRHFMDPRVHPYIEQYST